MSDRHKFIGASDLASIVGVSPFKTPLRLYLEKRGEAESFAGSPATKWGTALEDLIRREFSVETGLPVKRCNKVFVHPQHDFIAGHLDGIAGVNPRRAVFEAKTSNAYAVNEWADGIPEYYVTQVQAYMGLSKLGEAYIAVLIGGQDYRIFHTQFDPELYEMLIEQAVQFWQQVQAGIPPAPTAKDAKLLGRLYQVESGKAIELPGEWEATLQARQQIKGDISALEQHLEDIDTEIKATIQDAELAVCGLYKVSWKQVVSNRLDTARLKAELPDIYQRYCAESVARRFEVRTNGNGGAK